MSLIVADLLLKGGSMLLDLFGKAKGGTTQVVTTALSNVINSVQNQTPQTQRNMVASAIERLPPEQQTIVAQLKLDIEKVTAQREQNQYQHDIDMHTQSQETIRAGDKVQGEYTRQTRPKMARLSGYAGTAYVIGAELLHVFSHGSGANLQLAGMIFTPLLAYMGLRTWDAFSSFKGKTL